MIFPRIIPCLLVHNRGLVKTIRFKDPKYVGDPINAVKIFNEKEVDELIVLDIDATRYNRGPDFKMIEDLAYECRMPLCYGGGIKTVEQAKKIFSLGVEKIAISSAAIESPQLISSVAECVGSQSIAVVLDVRQDLIDGHYTIWTHNATKNTGIACHDFIVKAENAGAGEIVINSIDNDGLMKGYDKSLISKVRDTVSIPLTVLGGAGSIDDMGSLIQENGILGIAAGSLFVFKGKFRAVLINYPTPTEKEVLIGKNLESYHKR